MVWFLHVAILFILELVYGPLDIPIVGKLIYLIITLIMSYIIITLLFEKFVFRKIKLIYKFISESKDSLKNVQNFGDQSTSLEQVNQTVLDWATSTEKEISTLKSLAQYRKKYVGDISHELKTPLFAIQGYLHTLLEGGLYDENINRKYLSSALKNTDRLQTIVDDLELISQMESQAEELELADFNIKDLVDEVFSDLELMAKESEIDLIYKQGADRGFMVNADKEKIRHVLINLINNSIKYGRRGGLTKISFYDVEEVVLIEISDNGIGIQVEDMKHVFDRFYRADKSRSQTIKGTGLGLSIVKHIIEAHKQKITIRSTYGKGSTFGFTLKKA